MPVVMAYTDCYGVESEIANCSGFNYDPYIPSWYCTPERTAGVKCLSKPLI